MLLVVIPFNHRVDFGSFVIVRVRVLLSGCILGRIWFESYEVPPIDVECFTVNA